MLKSLLLALFLGTALAQPRQELPEGGGPVLLVAAPGLVSPAYFHSVLLAVPSGPDMHLGFIVNRPTRQSLASLFPEHEPSKKVHEPVFFGGPMSLQAVFAVVKTDKDPGGGSIGMLDNLYLVTRVDLVDRIIETTPNDARYYVGYVGWRPGELRSEIDRGLWSVLDAEVDTVFRKDTENLWEELLQSTRRIRAGDSVPFASSMLEAWTPKRAAAPDHEAAADCPAVDGRGCLGAASALRQAAGLGLRRRHGA